MTNDAQTIEDWSGGTWHANGPAAIGDRSGGTWWPVGDSAVPLDRLKQLFALSARFHARQAVRLFVSDDYDGRDNLLQAAISAGTAVELMAKSYLASINNALLADRGDRDAMLVLCGHSSLATAEPWNIRTLAATEALNLAKHIHRDLPWVQSDPISLRVRNAAAHSGMVERAALRRAVTQMCRVVESLLNAIGLDIDKFWGSDAATVVDELLDDARSQVQREVVAKQVAARARLRELLQGLPEDGQRALLGAMSGRRPRTSIDHDEPQICPVCNQQAWLICAVEDVDVDVDIDIGFDGSMMVVRQRWAEPAVFECPVCGLELEGEELQQFTFPTEIHLEDEPDEQDDWPHGPEL